MTMARLGRGSVDLFDSAWLKWGQAVLHTQALQRDIESFSADPERQPRTTTVAEYNSTKHGFVVALTAIDPIPDMDRWSVIVGDIVQCHRACLDHIAWALYRRGSKAGQLSAWEESGVYFPSALTRATFNASLVGKRPKLPGIRIADRAIVRRYQPYACGEKRGAPRHTVAILDRLANDDKHRSIQPVLTVPQSGNISIEDFSDCEISGLTLGNRRAPMVTLTKDTKLALIRVRKTGPNPRMEVKTSFTAEPSLYNGRLLGRWAADTMTFVCALLYELSEPTVRLRSLGLKRPARPTRV
jgi:hypothetical protein